MQTIYSTLIMLDDGSWGSLAGAIIFNVPEEMEAEFSCMDEHEIADAINDNKLDLVARFAKE